MKKNEPKVCICGKMILPLIAGFGKLMCSEKNCRENINMPKQQDTEWKEHWRIKYQSNETNTAGFLSANMMEELLSDAEELLAQERARLIGEREI